MNVPGLDGLGRFLIVAGVVLVGLGLLLHLGSSLGLGRLPGDIVIRRGNFTFFFPVTTAILLSLILTVILNLLRRP
ncbi:MAG TPA: DUF2905 domain-containing protein [Clostridiales bacterium]|nr:DUF2905 domain-containing protein [Clostridiales bacterium]